MKNICFVLLAFLMVQTACRKVDRNADSLGVNDSTSNVKESGLLTYAPLFPTDTSAVTLTFNAAAGNAALKDQSGSIYIHTGVITDKSASPTDWKYVTSTAFNQASGAVKTTSLGNNKYSFTLIPRSFYKVPDGEKILKLVMLFRNEDGTLVARNSDNSDIFLPIFEANKLNVRFTSEMMPTYTPTPVISAKLVGDELSISGAASQSSSLTLSLNGTTFATATGIKISGTTKIAAAGRQTIILSANSGAAIDSFSFLINGVVETADLPAGAKDGVTFINNGTSAIFNIYAPEKQYAYVLGDFNNWQADTKYFMKRTPDAKRWWIQVDGLDASKTYTYQYWVDGSIKVADPYAQLVLDPDNDQYISAATFPNMPPYPTNKTTGIVSVMQATPATYSWTTTNYIRPDKKNLVIYELHVRDFLAAHNYETLKDTLSYLQTLGINAVELMPVNEFEGNSSWGYNPSFYFAPDKYYGTKVALQSFIDACHSKGIAVILDMVLNHSFGQSPMVQLYFNNSTNKPADNSPWFNVDAKHPFNVGYDFNHESEATKYFAKNVMQFWMQEYKIDGYRFDLSKGFTQTNNPDNVDAWGQYDASRVAIWRDYNNFMKSIDPNFYVILEHFAADQEEQELANDGMMLWNNVNGSFSQASMGYNDNWDFSRIFYDKHGFSEATAYNLVTYMESHDEERLMFKNLAYGNGAGAYSIKTLATALQRQAMAEAFLLASPGPKMLWEFGENGYDVSIDNNGRTGEKPPHWEYRNNTDRANLYNTFAKLIKMKIKNEVFTTTSYNANLSGNIKYITLKGADANVVVMGNFDVTPQLATVPFASTGTWYDNLSGTTTTIASTSYTTTLAPGEFHVYSSKLLNQ